MNKLKKRAIICPTLVCKEFHNQHIEFTTSIESCWKTCFLPSLSPPKESQLLNSRFFMGAQLQLKNNYLLSPILGMHHHHHVYYLFILTTFDWVSLCLALHALASLAYCLRVVVVWKHEDNDQQLSPKINHNTTNHQPPTTRTYFHTKFLINHQQKQF